MFKVAKIKLFWWPITVEVPQDDGNTFPQEFDAQFEMLEQQEHDRIMTGKAELLERVVTGNFKRVKNEAGTEDLPSGDETKRMLLAISYVRAALVRAYYEAFYGRKAERKNS